MLVAPASKLFSTSSFTTEQRSTMTCPDCIWWTCIGWRRLAPPSWTGPPARTYRPGLNGLNRRHRIEMPLLLFHGARIGWCSDESRQLSYDPQYYCVPIPNCYRLAFFLSVVHIDDSRSLAALQECLSLGASRTSLMGDVLDAFWTLS